MSQSLIPLFIVLGLLSSTISGEQCGGLNCGADSCCLLSPTSAACYQSSIYACLQSSSGNILCPRGNAACGTGSQMFCYDPSGYNCINGQLQQRPAGSSSTGAQQTTTAPTTAAPITTAPPASTTVAPPSGSSMCGSNNLNCGSQSCCVLNSGSGICYSPSMYACSNGVLCPAGFQGCANGACFNPSEYSCVNGQLQQTGSAGTSTTGSSTTGTNPTTGTPTSAPPSTTQSPPSTTTQSGSNLVPVKLWGINYRATRPSGACPTLADVEADLRILATLTTRIRIYSIVDCNQGQLILQAIQNTGVDLTVTFGLWLDGLYYTTEFPNEYSALLNILNSGLRLDKVDDFIVGSETQYRGDFSWEVLVGFMQNISSTLASYGYRNIDVVTSDVIYNIIGSPIPNYENLVYVNQFPYWEGARVGDALNLLINTINTLRNNIGNKPIVIGETGWPTGGNQIGASEPGVNNLNAYLQSVVCYLHSQNIGYFWFSAFDEPFRAEENGNTVERFFGLYNGDRTPKAGVTLPVMCPA